MTTEQSLATLQRSLGDPTVCYPLRPPVTSGCPRTSTDRISYPVEVDYAYDRVDPAMFATTTERSGGLDRWAPLLPPLAAPGLGEGGTPLIAMCRVGVSGLVSVTARQADALSLVGP